MERTTHSAQQPEKPILVVDKEGTFGLQIANNFAKQKVCVLVSGHVPQKKHNLIFVPYKRQIPRIPNSAFALFYLVYEGDTHLVDFLPNFVRKAKEDKTHIFFLINIRNATESVMRKVSEYGSIVTIVLIGDIVGEGSWKNPVTAILAAAKTGTMVLPQNGLYPVYPVSGEDVFGVITATSQRKEASQSRTIYVLPSHPITAASFIRLLMKHEPLLKVDFSDKPLPKPSYAPPPYISVFGQNYPIEQKIPVWTIAPLVDELKRPKKKRRTIKFPQFRGVKGSIVIIVVSVLLVVLSPLAFSGIAAGLLLQAQSQVRSGNMIKARSDAVAAKQFFSLAKQSDALLVNGLRAVRIEGPADSLQYNVETGSYISQLVVDGIDGFTLLKRVFNGTSPDPKTDFREGLNNMRYALTRLRTLQAENRIPEQYQAHISQIEKQASPLLNTIDVLPALFGMDGKRTYLVLFQNNMELRPGGGFIGSYALLKIDKGRIAEMKIQDVYAADGQLRDHIEPPFQLRRYLGSQHWFLRDSNFDVNFPNDAALAGYFYNLEMGEKVEGIIAVDTSFLRNLLKAVGPIEVSEYNETITAENFFSLTEAHAQNNFFPGSTQKKDFLSSVYNKLLSRLTESRDLPYEQLLIVVGESIRQKHLLFGFPDTSLQKLFSVNGLSSSLSDTRVGKSGTINDFFGINEANLGQNKSNYYLNRAISHKVILGTDGIASETATIQYQNKSTATSAFGGDYKAYLRLIVPASAQLVSISIDGVQQPFIDAVTNPSLFSSQLFRPPQQLEVDRAQQNGKTLFGFLLIVPAGSKKTVSISYTIRTDSAVNTSAIGYNLWTFKQPGTEADPYVLNIVSPPSYTVLDKSAIGKEQDGVITFLSDMSQDREFSLQLTKK